MRPPDEICAVLLEGWCRKAQEDLGVAQLLLTEEYPYLNAIAFHAQQAAEKFLKAYLTILEIPFPKTHDIKRLVKLAAGRDNDIVDRLEEAFILSDFGVDVRDPRDVPDLSQFQAASAVSLATEVRDYVHHRINGLGYKLP